MMNTGVEEAEISSFEKDCIKKLDEQPDFEEELSSGKDDASHRLWHSFQDSATAVSKFYLAFTDQTRTVPEPLYGAMFHEAASSITKLYSEAGDVCSRGIDLGIDYGSQKRTREFLNWLKKKKKYIRRDELISFLTGEPIHPNEHSSTQQSSGSVLGQMEEEIPCPLVCHNPCGHHGMDFNTTLTQSVLPGSMSPRLHQHSPADSPSHSMNNTSAPRRKTTLQLGDPHQFFRDICIDHTRKRIHGSPQDMVTDYPSAKREKVINSPQQ